MLNHFTEKKLRRLICHEHHLDASSLEELSGMGFIFICIDDGESKKMIVQKLVGGGISFCDVGIGLQAVDNALTGSLRVTTGTVTKHDHLASRIPFSNTGDDAYAQNIQIAELNALNAALAVVKWKKMAGFYHDLEKEHNAFYEINLNKIITDDVTA